MKSEKRHLVAAGGLFEIGVISLIAAGHLYAHIQLASILLQSLPTDNKVDVACRILEIIGLVSLACSVLLFLGMRLRDRTGRSGSFMAMFGAYLAYFFYVGIVASIKGARGYKDPTSKPDGDADEGKDEGWMFCFGFLIFTYCW